MIVKEIPVKHEKGFAYWVNQKGEVVKFKPKKRNERVLVAIIKNFEEVYKDDKKTFMYYIAKSESGNLNLCKAKLTHKKRRSKKLNWVEVEED